MATKYYRALADGHSWTRPDGGTSTSKAGELYWLTEEQVAAAGPGKFEPADAAKSEVPASEVQQRLDREQAERDTAAKSIDAKAQADRDANAAAEVAERDKRTADANEQAEAAEHRNVRRDNQKR